MLKAALFLAFRGALWVCYLPFRLLHPQHKAVFFSRQSNTPGLDFILLEQALLQADPTLQTVMLCKTIGKGLKGKLSYGLHLFSQMYHLATAKVAVLDGYCLGVSLLPQKNSLTVYQLWHALGLLKKFGYAAVGAAEGSSARTARILRMHKGYHKVCCSSTAIAPQIAKCYQVPEEAMLPVGLPRVDFLRDPLLQIQTKESIYAAYPSLADGKPILLYVPTFRKNGASGVEALIEATDLTRYHLVIKEHNGNQRVLTHRGELTESLCLTGLEWLTVAAHVVTDYSAILFEALTAGKPVTLYCFDLDQYYDNRGFAIDYQAIPLPHCTTPAQVMASVADFPSSSQEVATFLRHHVSPVSPNCTQALVQQIMDNMKNFQKMQK